MALNALGRWLGYCSVLAYPAKCYCNWAAFNGVSVSSSRPFWCLIEYRNAHNLWSVSTSLYMFRWQKVIDDGCFVVVAVNMLKRHSVTRWLICFSWGLLTELLAVASLTELKWRLFLYSLYWTVDSLFSYFIVITPVTLNYFFCNSQSLICLTL